jgi:hypothetical protein
VEVGWRELVSGGYGGGKMSCAWLDRVQKKGARCGGMMRCDEEAGAVWSARGEESLG